MCVQCGAACERIVQYYVARDESPGAAECLVCAKQSCGDRRVRRGIGCRATSAACRPTSSFDILRGAATPRATAGPTLD